VSVIRLHTTVVLPQHFVPILINFQLQMEQIIQKYWNEKMKIGLTNWRVVYLLDNEPVELIPEVYNGNLVYRQRGSTKRFSYKKTQKRPYQKAAGHSAQTSFLVPHILTFAPFNSNFKI